MTPAPGPEGSAPGPTSSSTPLPSPEGSAPDPWDTTPATDRPVGWPELGIALGVAAVLYAIGIALFLQIPADQPVLIGLAQYAVSGLAPIGGLVAALLLRRRRPQDFGLRRVPLRWLGISAAIGVGIIALNLAVTAVVVTLTDPVNVQSNYQSAATSGVASFLGALALGAVLTPVGEELLFRGVLANALARYGPWVAVLGSSLVFALAHGINVVFPVALIVGVAAALLLRRTGSVWPGVVVHAANNSFSVVVPAVLSLLA